VSISAKIVAIAIFLGALAAGAWKIRHDAYKEGAQSEITKSAALATKAAISAMKTQERLQDAVTQIGERHEKTKRAIAISADSASSELAGLRGELSARNRRASEETASACRVDAGGAERELLGHCAAHLVGLAKEADRIEAKLIGLQDYVSNVCLK
jgi:hypothetical protein